MSQLIHIADRVLNRPLMIHPDKLALIASVLEGRIGIDASELKELTPEGSRFVGSASSQDGRSKAYRVHKGVAVVAVLGSLVNRGAWLGAKSGMTSYEGLGFQLDEAAADPDVRSIVLDIDSPGGEAVGAFEIADKVRSLAKSKNVVAIVNGMAASAAYAIASAATSITSTPSGVSGSIGVVLMHADYSGKLQQDGIRPTLIHAGAHKVDGHPYGPLPESVRADLQAEVNQFYDLFVSSVAKGRKGRMTEKAVRGTEARTLIGQAAVDAGLVDAIGSFEAVLADLSRGTARNSNPKRMSMSDNTYNQTQLDGAVSAARAEATTATTNLLRAEFDGAIQAATATARSEGAKAERERINAIIGSDEGKERSKSALHLAMTTDLSADQAKAALAGLPKETVAAATAAAHGLFLAENSNPSAAGEKGDYGWGDIVAKVTNKTAR